MTLRGQQITMQLTSSQCQCVTSRIMGQIQVWRHDPLLGLHCHWRHGPPSGWFWWSMTPVTLQKWIMTSAWTTTPVEFNFVRFPYRLNSYCLDRFNLEYLYYWSYSCRVFSIGFRIVWCHRKASFFSELALWRNLDVSAQNKYLYCRALYFLVSEISRIMMHYWYQTSI